MVAASYKFRFSEMERCGYGLFYNDIDIVTRYSDILPGEVSTKTRMTRNIPGNIPVWSAAMSDVTEAAMAIKLGLLGGIGVIHKNNTPDEQSAMVRKAKRFKQGCITDPVVLSPRNTIDEVIRIREQHGYKTIPITQDGSINGKLVGLIKDTSYSKQKHRGMKVAERMMPVTDVLVNPQNISLDEANEILLETGRRELLVVDDIGNFHGMYKRADIDKSQEYPNACKDGKGRLVVAAAVGGPGNDIEERSRKLAEADVDIFCIDTSQGHSKGVGEMTLPYLKKMYPRVDVIAGNIDSAEGARFLTERGADAIKVGVGPSPICRTKRNIGGGIPQLTAIYEVSRATDVPVIADGGIIDVAGDLMKALAAGASSVMIGSLLAGTDESPGKEITLKSRPGRYKEYKGMGTRAAQMQGSSSRYFQEGVSADRIVSHGVVSAIPYRGPVERQILHIIDTLKDAMSKYYGCRTIGDIRKGDLEFVHVHRSTPAEPPHGMVVIEDE
jgi:IMP dehydrogenase